MKKFSIKKMKAMTSDYTEWLYDRLADKKAAYDYIRNAFEEYQEDYNSEALLLALKDVANAQGGIGWLAKQTQLNREHLYRLLSGKGNPRLDTLSLILGAFGMQVSISISRKRSAIG